MGTQNSLCNSSILSLCWECVTGPSSLSELPQQSGNLHLTLITTKHWLLWSDSCWRGGAKNQAFVGQESQPVVAAGLALMNTPLEVKIALETALLFPSTFFWHKPRLEVWKNLYDCLAVSTEGICFLAMGAASVIWEAGFNSSAYFFLNADFSANLGHFSGSLIYVISSCPQLLDLSTLRISHIEN